MNGFEKILYTEHRGKINAITSKQIEKEFGYKGKDIRRIVNEMRCQGIPICSCSKGYFYAASVDDINETLAHLKSRIISIQAAQDGMNQSKMMYKEDQKS
jgi:hypothetical protein